MKIDLYILIREHPIKVGLKTNYISSWLIDQNLTIFLHLDSRPLTQLLLSSNQKKKYIKNSNIWKSDPISSTVKIIFLDRNFGSWDIAIDSGAYRE